MSAWHDAIVAHDLPGAIDPPAAHDCPDCGDPIDPWQTRCDRCARLDRHQEEYEASQQSHDDPRR